STIENGWYLDNPSLGMPGELHYHDFPLADSLHFLIVKLLALCSRDHALVGNLYFLLTFPLAALSALFVFRRFQLAYGPALVGSLLFAFLPYHFIKGTGPLFLAGYFLVPLVVLVALELCLSSGAPRQQPLCSWQTLGAVVICMLTSSAGIYYAFFACFLLLVAGAAAAIGRRQSAPLYRSGVLVGCVAAGTLANLAPTLVYQYHHGT